MHLVYSNHCLQFLLSITDVSRESKTMVMQFILGEGGVGGWGETICIMAYVKRVNKFTILNFIINYTIHLQLQVKHPTF